MRLVPPARGIARYISPAGSCLKEKTVRHGSWSAKGRVVAALLLPLVGGFWLVRASDHSDVPQSGTVVRQDANITDLHAFVKGSNLVLALSTNPAIPRSAATYIFPSDVTYEISMDVDSRVDTSSDPFGDGGVVLDAQRISEDVTFRIRFQPDGSAKIQRIARGGLRDDAQLVSFFAGLRDDPFIRIPRDDRNVGAIVLEVPLTSLAERQSTLLIWATTQVDTFDGAFQEMVGRSLRSMFPEQGGMNLMAPKHHFSRLGLRPDVMIFDTAQAAAFPNGRALTDDVILLACTLGNECRVFNSEAAGRVGFNPRSNDLPYLDTFTYLAPPHTPVP